MRKRFVGLFLAMVLLLSLSLVMRAQDPSKAKQVAVKTATVRAAAKPDLSGIWKGRNVPVDFDHPDGPSVGAGGGWKGAKRTGGGFGFLDSKMEQPTMLPWAAARYKAFREGALEAMQPVKNVEPNINCIPGGFPWIYDRAQLDPFEIIQSSKKIVMIFSTGCARYLHGLLHR
jgi:hypothetical protein